MRNQASVLEKTMNASSQIAAQSLRKSIAEFATLLDGHPIEQPESDLRSELHSIVLKLMSMAYSDGYQSGHQGDKPIFEIEIYHKVVYSRKWLRPRKKL